MRMLKKQCHNILSGRLEGNLTRSKSFENIEYCVDSLIVSGRLCNPAQVESCCAYFIAHQQELNEEALIDKRRNVHNRKKIFSIGAMERSCGLRDQHVELNQNDGKSVCEGPGALPCYVLNLKVQRKYDGMKIDNNESDWIAAVQTLDALWEKTVGKERIGPKPYTMEEEEEEEEQEEETGGTPSISQDPPGSIDSPPTMDQVTNSGPETSEE